MRGVGKQQTDQRRSLDFWLFFALGEWPLGLSELESLFGGADVTVWRESGPKALSTAAMVKRLGLNCDAPKACRTTLISHLRRLQGERKVRLKVGGWWESGKPLPDSVAWYYPKGTVRFDGDRATVYVPDKSLYAPKLTEAVKAARRAYQIEEGHHKKFPKKVDRAAVHYSARWMPKRKVYELVPWEVGPDSE